MPDKEKKSEDEDEDNLTCSNCGDVYENTAALRRLKNKTGKFICPDCLAELHGKEAEETEETEEEEEEDEPEDEAEEPEPEAEKPKKKK